MTKPKTWAEKEIVALIATEIDMCRQFDSKTERTPAAWAKSIYAVLREKGLIEGTP